MLFSKYYLLRIENLFPVTFFFWWVVKPTQPEKLDTFKRHTLPSAKMISGKNVLALGSMVLYLKDKWKSRYQNEKRNLELAC